MIALFAAMEQELKSIFREIRGGGTIKWKDLKIRRGTFEKTEFVAATTGVGKVYTAAAVQKILSEFQCSASLFTGIAGAINPTYHIGDVFYAKDLLQWDMDATPFSFQRGEIPYTRRRFETSDTGILNTALNYTPQEESIHTGRLLTGDTFLTRVDKQQHDFLYSELKGDAVDMESAAAAFVSNLQDVPFFAYKIISDQVDGSVPKNFAKFIRNASDKLLEISRFIVKAISD